MANTLFIIVILNLFSGSFGVEKYIYLRVIQNGTTKVSKTDVHVHFNPMENIVIDCNVDKYLTVGNNYNLSFIKDGVTIQRTREYLITYSEALTSSDDDKELLCQALSSRTPGIKWKISVYFHMIKTGKETKQNSFTILLICIAGFIGGSLVLLVCYAIIRRIRKKKNNEESGPDDFPLSSKEVAYAEIDTSIKAKNRIQQKTENPEYAEIGFFNQSCDIKENNKSNDSHSKNDSKENRTEKQDETKMYNNVDRHGSSTDC